MADTPGNLPGKSPHLTSDANSKFEVRWGRKPMFDTGSHPERLFQVLWATQRRVEESALSCEEADAHIARTRRALRSSYILIRRADAFLDHCAGSQSLKARGELEAGDGI